MTLHAFTKACAGLSQIIADILNWYNSPWITIPDSKRALLSSTNFFRNLLQFDYLLLLSNKPIINRHLFC